MSTLAEKMLGALRQMAATLEPHPCGGFTLEDVKWQLAMPFADDQDMHCALDELVQAKAVRFAGVDEDEHDACCYAIRF